MSRRVPNASVLRLPAEAQARFDAWQRARRDAGNGGPEAMRCDIDGCPWPAGYCTSHPVAKAVA